MLLFLDTEFTDLSREGALISLALVASENQFLYAEVVGGWQERLEWLRNHKKREYNAQALWIEDNVLPGLRYTKQQGRNGNQGSGGLGTREEIAQWVFEFIMSYEEIELVSDVGNFDMMHFIGLFGDALYDVPKNIVPGFWDYNQKLAEIKYGNSIARAFEEGRNYTHNALEDALILRDLWIRLL